MKGIELIASENFVSDQVMQAMGSCLTNKYAEGYPGKRYYGGCEVVDQSETIAIERLKKLFNAEWANVQPHSGAQANAAVFFAVLNPGDTFLGLNLSHGGHLSHGSPVNSSGVLYHATEYNVKEDTGRVDYDQMEEVALREKPKLIVGGGSAYSRDWDYKRMREIADKVGALLMIDMAHPAGLIAAGLLNNPLEYAHIVIKVNQVGYFSNGAKTARVSYFEKFGSLDGKTYEIVDAEQGDVVATGTLPTAQKEETLSGELVHTISFDAVTESGSYYIRIPDAGLDASARSPQDVADGLDTDTILSPTFSIENHVYDALFSDMTKYFYYQRQGIDLEETYAGVFARENLHPNDVTVKKWSDRDNPNAETYDVSGGWYDAGDYGKYVSPAAGTVEDLLLAYELFPDTFNNMDLNIPETDPNNARYVDAPGMLSELKWELDMLLKLEHSDKDGSFYVAANYKDDVIYLEDTLRSTDTYQSDDSAKDLRSHLATADAAAIFAHAYLVYREIPAYADFADTCLETALRAWNWVTDPSNPKHMSIGAANRTYTFTQEEFDRDLFWAAGSLYRAVKTAGGDVSPYENYLLANCNTDAVQNCFKNISLSYNHAGESFLGFFHYLYQNEQPNAAMTEAFSNFTPWRTNMLQHNNWGMVFPNWGYWWGSNRNVAQNAMTLLLGSVIMEGQDNIPTAVSEAADHAFDYLLGDNPISFSYVSGYGERSVENIYSKIYSVDAALTPYQVPKGYVTEGTNNHNNRHLSKFDGKCYMDSDTEYTTNENTIYGNASALFLTAAVIAGHTEPDPEPDTVQGDVNADGTFDLADVVMLQKWLIRAGTLTDWTAGDWNDDETITVVDLCLMKRALQQA